MTFEAVGSEVTMGVRRHRRYSTEFKLRLVEAYLAGEGSANGVAKQHGVPRGLLLIWADKYRKGELTLDVQREEELQEYELKIAALERKVGQWTMEGAHTASDVYARVRRHWRVTNCPRTS